jgi:shikimate kinase
MRLVLAGFMGTGKTAVGRILARRLGVPFGDTDAWIEAREGATIAAIFATRGEAAFRTLEREALRALTRVPRGVVATGGGAIVDPENRAHLRAWGTLVCLDATPEAILARVGDRPDRPLLAGPDRLDRIRRLRAERAAAYADVDVRVDTTGRTPAEVAGLILEALAARARTPA